MKSLAKSVRSSIKLISCRVTTLNEPGMMAMSILAGTKTYHSTPPTIITSKSISTQKKNSFLSVAFLPLPSQPLALTSIVNSHPMESSALNRSKIVVYQKKEKEQKEKYQSDEKTSPHSQEKKKMILFNFLFLHLSCSFSLLNILNCSSRKLDQQINLKSKSLD